MEYPEEVIKAARVVITALGGKIIAAGAGEFMDSSRQTAGMTIIGDVLIPAELVISALAITQSNPQAEFNQKLFPETINLKIPKPEPEDLMDLWNDQRDLKLAVCMKLTTSRRRACAARLKEFPGKEDWLAFMRCINKSDWMLGNGPANSTHATWRASFDWFIKPDSIVKFLEGRYKSRDVPAESARERYGEELDRRSGSGEERLNG
jgi:hypothetical protein